jgi:hypothetical protein
MWPTHQRLAELWFIQEHQRSLTEEEWSEFKHCLEAHTRKAMKLSRLYNLSYVAHITNDTEWQHDLCAKIDTIKDELYDYM